MKDQVQTLNKYLIERRGLNQDNNLLAVMTIIKSLFEQNYKLTQQQIKRFIVQLTQRQYLDNMLDNPKTDEHKNIINIIFSKIIKKKEDITNILRYLNYQMGDSYLINLLF